MSCELSVLIVNYNTALQLERCLLSLAGKLPGIPHEVIVIDNASSDGSAALLKTKFPAIRLIESAVNEGFAKAMNRGLREAAGDYLLWINPDAELLDTGIRGLIDYLKAHPEAGILGPKILNTDGTLQLSSRSFPSYETALFNRYSLLTRLFPENPASRRYLQPNADPSAIRAVDWVSGACLLHRREVSERLGGLDEGFFMYCEDVDFCLRAGKAGWKTLYHPGLSVRHEIGASSCKLKARMVREHHRSMRHYYQKHLSRNPFQDLIVYTAIAVREKFLTVLAEKPKS